MLEWDQEVTYKLIKLEKKNFTGKRFFSQKCLNKTNESHQTSFVRKKKFSLENDFFISKMFE